MKKRILCVIPARKGSKGLKNKNFLFFDKKRLIHYPILKSTKIDHVSKTVFSSDSKKYINFVKKKFKQVDTLLRDKKLANDESKTFDVVLEALKHYEKNNVFFDIILLLEPTSPLTSIEMINKGINLLLRNFNKFDAVIPVVNLPKFNSAFSINIKKNMFTGKKFPNNLRRQKFNTYFLSGNFYISKVTSYIKNKGFYSKKTYAVTVDQKFYSDIDDIYDFKEAEFKKNFFNLK